MYHAYESLETFTKIWLDNLQGRDHLEDLRVEENLGLQLKWI
jgi:hypothetical protein